MVETGATLTDLPTVRTTIAEVLAEDYPCCCLDDYKRRDRIDPHCPAHYEDGTVDAILAKLSDPAVWGELIDHAIATDPEQVIYKVMEEATDNYGRRLWDANGFLLYRRRQHTREERSVSAEYYDMDGQPMTIDEWREAWPNMDARRIGWDDINDVTVSTVWLGLNHNLGDGEPLIFETMMFGEHGEYQWRWHTKQEALVGHQRIVAAVREGREPE